MTYKEHAVWALAVCCVGVLLFYIFAEAAETRGALDLQRAEAVRFDRHWDQYLRHLFGCPDSGPTTSETCRLPQGMTDHREFAKAREQAKTLFRLKD